MLMFIILLLLLFVVYYLSLLHCHSLRKTLSSKPYNVSASFLVVSQLTKHVDTNYEELSTTFDMWINQSIPN